jgi:hypothetical protein
MFFRTEIRVILLILVICENTQVLSQANDESRSTSVWWTSFNAGALPASNFSLIFDLNHTIEETSFVFFMGDYRTDEITGDNYPRYESMGSTLGIGKLWNDRLVMMALSTGVSLDFLVKEDFYLNPNTMEYMNSKTQGLDFGVPVRLFAYIKSNWIGIGLHAMYKITLYDSYGSVGISIALGRFNPSSLKNQQD